MINFVLQSHRPILYLKRQQKVHPAKRFEILKPRQHGLLCNGHSHILHQTLSHCASGTLTLCTRNSHIVHQELSQCAPGTVTLCSDLAKSGVENNMHSLHHTVHHTLQWDWALSHCTLGIATLCNGHSHIVQ